MDVDMTEDLLNGQPIWTEELEKEIKWLEERGQYLDVRAALPDEFERIWKRIVEQRDK